MMQDAYEKDSVAVLGAGPAGISAAYHLKLKGAKTVIYEKKEDYGGLCGGFDISGYHFDYFAHMTFSKDKDVNGLLEEKTPYLVHMPEAMNYYQKKWIRNPVQTNLNGLDADERVKVITDFVNRKQSGHITDYEQWLKSSYGDYFADNFPARYTRKYWTVEPAKLETEWVKSRMYVPSLEEILMGAFETDTPNVHYSKEMHYPKSGGFKAFLEPLINDIEIKYNKEITQIDTDQKRIGFADGSEAEYKNIVSTLPLRELPDMLKNVPDCIKEAADRLDYTSGYMVSIGLNRKVDFPTIWFYIYDEDILPARVYFPDKKSESNTPKGCSALQAEVYVSKYRNINLDENELLESVSKQLIGMNLFTEKDIVFRDIRFESYANIMFTPDIYTARKTVRDYVEKHGIICAGRFGEWDYLWLEQSLLSGKRAAEKILYNGID